jgi:hypothetical protein
MTRLVGRRDNPCRPAIAGGYRQDCRTALNAPRYRIVAAAPHLPGSRDVDRPVGSARRPGTADRLFAVGAFAMFVVVWVGFAVGLRGDHAFLDTTWEWLRGLPAPIAVVVWLVFLPIACGLWIWESSWTPLVGSLLAVGMVAWTLVAVAGVRRAFRAA